MKKPSFGKGKAAKQVSYDHAKIEPKWQKKWARSKIYRTTEDGKKEKSYILDMFPYPSGEGLHVGHPKGYIATDIVSRMKRMQGKSVLHPMGFDAFGLPAENYALKTKTHPEVAVKKNVARYKKQLEILGFDYDWSREVNTTDPKYYKWTQWIFLQLFKAGLAYESYEPINWCPVDKTGLANEDIENGRCERCGALVEKKPMRQWVLKITDYADSLIADLDATDYVMPKLIDKVNPHQPGKPLIKRHVAHAIVFDPRTKKYLIIRNKKFGWDTVIIGGIENGEKPEDTARREVREETGYTDLEFKRILGGMTEAHYYTKHKGENRIAYAQAAYFELKSDARVPLADGEDKDNEILWVGEKDFVPGKMVNSELGIWLERLSAEVVYDPKKPGVPCFMDRSISSAIREDLPFVERNAVSAIVKHWSEDKYMGIRWKKVPWRSLITGGPEGDQTLEEGAIQEIIEETGYLHPVLVRKLGNVDAKFFHPPKNINRFAHFNAFLFELKDGERRELTTEEQERHDAVWLTKEEMSEFLTPASQRHIWNTLFLGKKNVIFPEVKPLLDWPESIKELQRNWIGRSEGAEIKFEIRRTKSETNSKSEAQNIAVFTTRPDTLFGVTYVVLAPEHALVEELLSSVDNKKEVEAYVAKASKETEIDRTDATKEKTGVELKGVKAINPANQEEVPVWIADYVLADYGTGAVMAVPAHDERDFAFAKKFGLPMREVIAKEFMLTGPDTLRAGLPIIKRRTVSTVIKHPTEDLYLVLKEGDNEIFVGGGIEDSETPEQALSREIKEETGYVNFRIERVLAEHFFCTGYRVSKQRNQRTDDTFYYVILDDLDKVASEVDAGRHTMHWVPKDQVLKNTTWEHHLYIWKLFLKPAPYAGPGVMCNSAEFDGMGSEHAAKDITQKFGRVKVTYKLRDWVFSRQRYWGEPIPLIHCGKCGVVAVPEKDLPVKLPKVRSYEPTGTGESPLAAISKWVNVKCPQCKGPAKREANTMPQWAGSSWYYLRYEDPKNRKAFVDPKKEKYWSPVDLYVGGAEHATRHLIYARFWHKFLYDIQKVSTVEPFRKLQSVGLIMGEDGRKMSKRFGNVVNPDDIVKTFGADTLRIYEMFMGPFDQQIAWSTASIVGSRRFIERVWTMRQKIGNPDAALEKHIQKTIKKVTDDIAGLRFNTAISSLMILSNEVDRSASIGRGQIESILKLLAPFAPHVADELWSSIGNKRSIHISAWPDYDPALAADDEATIVVQVNGKVRGSFTAAFDADKDAVEKQARSVEGISKWLEGKEVVKVITVPNRLVNIVLK